MTYLWTFQITTLGNVGVPVMGSGVIDALEIYILLAVVRVSGVLVLFLWIAIAKKKASCKRSKPVKTCSGVQCYLWVVMLVAAIDLDWWLGSTWRGLRAPA